MCWQVEEQGPSHSGSSDSGSKISSSSKSGKNDSQSQKADEDMGDDDDSDEDDEDEWEDLRLVCSGILSESLNTFGCSAKWSWALVLELYFSEMDINCNF